MDKERDGGRVEKNKNIYYSPYENKIITLLVPNLCYSYYSHCCTSGIVDGKQYNKMMEIKCR